MPDVIPEDAEEGWRQHGWDILRDAYVSRFGEPIWTSPIESPHDMALDPLASRASSTWRRRR